MRGMSIRVNTASFLGRFVCVSISTSSLLEQRIAPEKEHDPGQVKLFRVIGIMDATCT